MGFFDRLTGTRRPGGEVAPRPAEDIRELLLGLNGPDVPYVVRDGAPEGVDLVAEWRLLEPAWQTFFARAQLSRRIRIRMNFALPGHEVRALDEHWKVKWAGGVPISTEYGRGPVKTTSRQWTIGRGNGGGPEVVETFRFDSSELKEPLRDTVLGAGWTWRGLVLRNP
ncbi:hypothetical protein [Streptomyces iconiensis]|uniref:DUF4166 domain-containing protein n=1 Tax=Streptomyces iconiensis TaxID=1384038 RepID=A0ABT6ZQG4_9ACTN|nr:hypothetical protein [Streptomyces iconiensis]MDJ1131297.1 hypothetical protein [Streptomyces iconiensis]